MTHCDNFFSPPLLSSCLLFPSEGKHLELRFGWSASWQGMLYFTIPVRFVYLIILNKTLLITGPPFIIEIAFGIEFVHIGSEDVDKCIFLRQNLTCCQADPAVPSLRWAILLYCSIIHNLLSKNKNICMYCILLVSDLAEELKTVSTLE